MTDNLINVVSKVIIVQEGLYLYPETVPHRCFFPGISMENTFGVYCTILDDDQDSTVVIFLWHKQTRKQTGQITSKD